MKGIYERYIAATKHWLRSYQKMKADAAYMRREHQKLEKELADYGFINAPIAAYGGKMPSQTGYALSTPVENGYYQIAERKKQLDELNYKIERTEEIIALIDQSFEEMNEEERGIIDSHYYRREDWRTVAKKYDCRREVMIRRGKGILQKFALIMFGSPKLLEICKQA